MSIYTTLRLPFLALTGFLILSSFIAGCNSGKEGKQLTKENGGEGTKLSAFHPILDAQVHEDDSLFLMSLITLKDEGFLLEGDMIGPVAGFVRQHGGVEKPDSVLLGMTYRQLLNRALVVDLSTEYGYDPTNCDGCKDSILIYLPGTDARLFVGMGRKGLQEMIREAFASNEVAEKYRDAPYNREIDSVNWQSTIKKISTEQKEVFDGVLFGNIMLVMSQEGKNPSKYTYGHILTVIDRVKGMPEFTEIRKYLTNLTSDTSTSQP